jgi:hypothetical protein
VAGEAGSFTAREDSGDSTDLQQTGNEVSGAYSRDEVSGHADSQSQQGANESSAYTLSQDTGQSATASQAGNTVTGDYTRSEARDTSVSLTQSSGATAVTETGDEAATLNETGSSVSGDYTVAQLSSEDYSLSETGSAFTLDESGTHQRTHQEVGSKVTQDYFRTEDGTDSYTMAEGGGYGVAVTGSDAYSLEESGNQSSGRFERNQVGTDDHDLGGSAGSQTFTVAETGNAQAGVLSLTETGGDRYSLLPTFDNASNAADGAAPGALDYSPVGRAFVLRDTASATLLGDGTADARLDGGVAPPDNTLPRGDAGYGLTPALLNAPRSAAQQQAPYAELGAEQYQDYCFAPETPLRTPLGDKPAGEFKPDDDILSAPDWDATLPVGVKRVENVWVGFARVVTLKVGGKLIRLTLAHRVFLWGKGWAPVGSAQPGDLVRSDNGREVAIEEVTDTGEEVAVVNLRVADYRTYFVGAADWNFSVWAHNEYSGDREENTRITQEVAQELGRYGIGNAAELAQKGAGEGNGRALLAGLRSLRVGLAYREGGAQAAREVVEDALGKPTHTAAAQGELGSGGGRASPLSGNCGLPPKIDAKQVARRLADLTQGGQPVPWEQLSQEFKYPFQSSGRQSGNLRRLAADFGYGGTSGVKRGPTTQADLEDPNSTKDPRQLLVKGALKTLFRQGQQFPNMKLMEGPGGTEAHIEGVGKEVRSPDLHLFGRLTQATMNKLIRVIGDVVRQTLGAGVRVGQVLFYGTAKGGSPEHIAVNVGPVRGASGLPSQKERSQIPPYEGAKVPLFHVSIGLEGKRPTE